MTAQGFEIATAGNITVDGISAANSNNLSPAKRTGLLSLKNGFRIGPGAGA